MKLGEGGRMKDYFSQHFIQQCRSILIEKKNSILNRVQTIEDEFTSQDFSGDEIDRSHQILLENKHLISQQKLRSLLWEIESALSRIEFGIFGICEETEEPIEEERLMAIPWTRLSLEGAELQESMQKKFANHL